MMPTLKFGSDESIVVDRLRQLRRWRIALRRVAAVAGEPMALSAVGYFLRKYPRVSAARGVLRRIGALSGVVGGDSAALYCRVLRQLHDVLDLYPRKFFAAPTVGFAGIRALRLVERRIGAAGPLCGPLAGENGIVRARILIGFSEKVTIFAR